MSEVKELTILEEFDAILADDNTALGEHSSEIENDFLDKIRAELFAKTNFVKSLQAVNKEQILEINEKVEKLIEFGNILQEGSAANREMFITLQHVGGIFNKMFDEISAAAKDTDFVDAGAITKILNNNKKFDIDESVFEEEVLVEHSVDTSFEG